MPRVSIIVPVYNAGPYVAECLASIERQTLDDIEVICIDDASADDSLAICQCFAAEDARFVIVSLPENEGAAAVRNRGIEMARGDYVLFMDADDWYPSDSTVELLYRAAADHGMNVAGGQMCEVDAETGKERVDFGDDGHLSLYNFDEEGVVAYRDWQGDFGYTRFIYNRALLVDNGIRFPNLIRHEDPVFFVKAMLAAGEFYALPVPVYCYRVNYKPIRFSKKALEDAVDAHVELLMLAQEADLQQLKKWVVESLCWYLTLDVYQSTTYRLGDAIARPYRKACKLLANVRSHLVR